LEGCPIAEAERKVLLDGKTKAVAYPAKGFNCNPYGIYSQQYHSNDPSKIQQEMPDSLIQARTWGPQVLYVPSKGDPSLSPGVDLKKLEHCPTFNDRMTLQDGVTKAVSYPQPGFNCNNSWALAQGAPAAAKDTRYVPHAHPGLKGFDLSTLEHCPDFNERMTLLNGKTKAVAYPTAGFNCNADYGLAQGKK